MIFKDIEERLTGERLKVPGSSTIIPDRTLVTFSGADIVAIGKALDVDFAPDTRKGFVRLKSPDKYSTRNGTCGDTDSPSVTPREVLSNSSSRGLNRGSFGILANGEGRPVDGSGGVDW